MLSGKDIRRLVGDVPEAVEPDILRLERQFVIERQLYDAADVVLVDVGDDHQLELTLFVRELFEARLQGPLVDTRRTSVDQETSDGVLAIFDPDAVTIASREYFQSQHLSSSAISCCTWASPERHAALRSGVLRNLRNQARMASHEGQQVLGTVVFVKLEQPDC